jgi:hypothetical protein
MRKHPPAEETEIARQIVSVLPTGSAARLCCDDAEAVRFVVTGDGLKLRSIVLNRESLRRLTSDPARDIKIEYLQRDLAGSAGRRAEFRYPRHSRIVRRTSKSSRLRAASLAVAALGR